MAVGLTEPAALRPVAGVCLGTAAAALRYQGRDDLVAVELAPGASCVAVFTRNAFCAAPVLVARRHLGIAPPRCLVINSGNANAGTGVTGVQAAEASCRALAAMAGCKSEEVLPFSTGVIGEPLPSERLEAALPQAWRSRSEDAWLPAARAIMTTDTLPKGCSRVVELGGGVVTVTGIAKGAGMIRPDMATMLAFLATDARVPAPVLRRCLVSAMDDSFHSITIDGDTSTNDACVLMASGQSTAPALSVAEGEAYRTFAGAVAEVAQALAEAIVRDGEGATRFLTIRVCGAADREQARRTAFAVAHSPLVKTAFFAGDPNWGRILAAVGRVNPIGLPIERVSVFLDEVCVVQGGGRAPGYTEEAGRRVLARSEIEVRIELGCGGAETRVWTTDLSYDYVRINADYRT